MEEKKDVYKPVIKNLLARFYDSYPMAKRYHAPKSIKTDKGKKAFERFYDSMIK